MLYIPLLCLRERLAQHASVPEGTPRLRGFGFTPYASDDREMACMCTEPEWSPSQLVDVASDAEVLQIGVENLSQAKHCREPKLCY
jgi:hypothetical protein